MQFKEVASGSAVKRSLLNSNDGKKLSLFRMPLYATDLPFRSFALLFSFLTWLSILFLSTFAANQSRRLSGCAIVHLLE